MKTVLTDRAAIEFWLQEYAQQLRMNPKSAKSAEAIERDFRNDCAASREEMPTLHSLLVDAALLIRAR